MSARYVSTSLVVLILAMGAYCRTEAVAVAGSEPDVATVVSRARQRVEILDRLQRIGQAMSDFHARFRGFPVAALQDAEGTPLLSWRVLLLPYLGEGDLYDQFRRDEPWDGPHNITLLEQVPEVYGLPGQEASGKTSVFVLLGERTLFGESVSTDRDVPIYGSGYRDIPDGTMHTILAVWAAGDKAVPWTKPVDLTLDPADPVGSLGDLLDEGIYVVMFDGTVHVLSRDIAPDRLIAFSTSRGGERVAVQDTDKHGLPVVTASEGEQDSRLPDQEGPIAQLRTEHREGEQRDRIRAAMVLEQIPEIAAPAVPELMEAIRSDEFALRDPASRALVGIGSRGASAVPELIEMLQDALQDERFGDPSTRPARHVCFVLAAIGEPAVAPLIELLQHENPRVQTAALETIAAIGPDAKDAVPELARLVGGSDGYLRTRALAGLAAVGPEARPALPVIKQRLDAGLSQAEEDALIRALVAVGPPAVPILAKALGHSDSRVRATAAKALAELGPASRQALQPLVQALRESHYVRVHAEVALARIGRPAVPSLLKLMKVEPTSATGLSDHALLDAVDAAERALIEMGAEAQEAIPELLRMLEMDKSGHWRPSPSMRAAKILGSIGKPALPELRSRLRAPARNVRFAAHVALRSMGADAGEALPDLIALFDAEIPDQLEALETIPAISRLDDEGVEAIIRLHARSSGPEDWSVRSACLTVLGRAAWTSPRTLEFLVEQLQQENESQRWEVMMMVVGRVLEMGYDPSVMRMLLTALEKEEDGSRVLLLALNAVSRIGPDAKDAVPVIARRLAATDDETLVRAAMEALAAIGPDAKPAIDAMVRAVQKSRHPEALLRYLRRVTPDADKILEQRTLDPGPLRFLLDVLDDR